MLINNNKPETLCRITFNCYAIDWDGYLLAHNSEKEYSLVNPKPPVYPIVHKIRMLPELAKPWFPLGSSEPYRSVPLVHPSEWETMARFFSRRFRLLTIDATKVENLTTRKHPALLHSEYFGKVSLGAIISDEEYTWVASSDLLTLPERAISWLSGENDSNINFLEETLGYAPKKIS